MTVENKIKANKVLLKMIKQSIDPIKDMIIAAYREEYAPEDVINEYANLGQVLDMAACLLWEWSGDPDYEDCERDFH